MMLANVIFFPHWPASLISLQMMEAEAKQLLLKELANGLTAGEVSTRAKQLFAPFLELAEHAGKGGEVMGPSGFRVAKAFVCKPDDEVGE